MQETRCSSFSNTKHGVSMAAEQVFLRPQDVVLLLKLAANRSHAAFTFRELAAQLNWSPSTVHACVARLRLARLMRPDGMAPLNVDLAALREFLIHGAKYAFPASFGTFTRGIATGHAAPPLRDLISQSGEAAPVWPSAEGDMRGIALFPLHPSVPAASRRDRRLYELLTLFDALRSGAARERELASQLLQKQLT